MPKEKKKKKPGNDLRNGFNLHDWPKDGPKLKNPKLHKQKKRERIGGAASQRG